MNVIFKVGLLVFSLILLDSCSNFKPKNREEELGVAANDEGELYLGKQEYPELDQEIEYNTDKSKDYLITLKTKFGDIKAVLYDETINHKKNFVKLATVGFYDSTSFHRVINEFMIQGGDPNSKGDNVASYGTGGPGYTIPAEFYPRFIHKRGAIAAARVGGPSNPEKESSGSQFYIVHGKKYSELELGDIELSREMHINQALNQVLNKPENIEVLKKAVELKNRNKIKEMEELLVQYKPEAQKMVDDSKVKFSEEAKKIYKELGGAAFLDLDYTVFGEVVQGIEIIDVIAKLPVGGGQGSLPKDKIVLDIDCELLTKKEITDLTGFKYN